MRTLIEVTKILCCLTVFSLGTSSTWAQSIDLDRQLGAQNAQMVEEQMGIYEDEELTNFVRQVGNRLVSQLDNPMFEFRFHVVDDPTPNAFALPGGYVYVTRGILSLITTEDELAGVMAHEIIHVVQRHSVKQMKKSILPKLFELPGQVVGSVVSEDLGKLLNAPIETSNKLLLSDYSRKHETEADVKGVSLAAKAGYDPSQLSVILARLSKAVEILTEEEEKKSYFDDHPYTPDRVSTINKTVKKLRWSQRPPISPDFPAPLDGMLFGHNPGHGVFQESTFIHPDLGFAIDFPPGWEPANKPNSVGVVHPDRQAAIFVGLDDSTKKAEDLGSNFARSIKSRYPRTPVQASTYSFKGLPAYLVSMEDDSGSEPMYIHVLWVAIDRQMFKLVGLGPTRYESELRKSAESLHPMTSEERQSVKKLEFKVVTGLEGETMEQTQSRVESPLKVEVNTFLNGLQKDQFIQDKRVKILVEEDY